MYIFVQIILTYDADKFIIIVIYHVFVSEATQWRS